MVGKTIKKNRWEALSTGLNPTYADVFGGVAASFDFLFPISNRYIDKISLASKKYPFLNIAAAFTNLGVDLLFFNLIQSGNITDGTGIKILYNTTVTIAPDALRTTRKAWLDVKAHIPSLLNKLNSKPDRVDHYINKF